MTVAGYSRDMESLAGVKSIAGLRILVVDDHVINREFLKTGLTRLAAEVDLADNGLDALERCVEKHFDVILLDLHMPKMDGLATAHRIRDLDTPSSNAHLIILTADTRPEEKERLLEAGIDAFLNKPISIPDLARAIQTVRAPDSVHEDPDSRSLTPTALIDRNQALAAANQDQALVEKLSAMLAVELKTGLPELDRMLGEGQHEQAASRLHQWTGAGGYVGATRFVQACQGLREILTEDGEARIGTTYARFVRTAQATRMALESQ